MDDLVRLEKRLKEQHSWSSPSCTSVWFPLPSEVIQQRIWKMFGNFRDQKRKNTNLAINWLFRLYLNCQA